MQVPVTSGSKSICAAGGGASKLIYCAVIGEGRRRAVAEDIRRVSQEGPSYPLCIFAKGIPYSINLLVLTPLILQSFS